MTSPDYEDIRKRLARPRPEPKLITMQGYWTLSGDGAHGTGPPPTHRKSTPPPLSCPNPLLLLSGCAHTGPLPCAWVTPLLVG